jgi:hypothetical protein
VLAPCFLSFKLEVQDSEEYKPILYPEGARWHCRGGEECVEIKEWRTIGGGFNWETVQDTPES